MSETIRPWLTPEGVVAILTILGVLLPIVAALARKAGKREAADAILDLSTRLEGAGKTIEAVVSGVESVRKNLEPAKAKALAEEIRSRAKILGVEDTVLAPAVRAVTQEEKPATSTPALVPAPRPVRRVS